MKLVELAQRADVSESCGREYQVEGRIIALFCHQGRFFALDGLCPHRDGPLAQGDVANGTVTCPWHAWSFSLEDGRSPEMPAARVRSYRTRVEGEAIYIELQEVDT